MRGSFPLRIRVRRMLGRMLSLSGVLVSTIACCETPATDRCSAESGGWYHVYPLDEATYAISEPHYWQQNVSYLLLGRSTAMLYDAGPGICDIGPVVASLTSFPVLAIPSHLHFDHVGSLPQLPQVALLDLPALRKQVHDGEFIPTAAQFMLEQPVRFRVDRWIRDGASVDLGGRSIMVVATPGHTPESLSLIDRSHKAVYIGDLFNRVGSLYNVPGSDIHQAAASLRRILHLVPGGGRVFEAHSEQSLELSDLENAVTGLSAIASGTVAGTLICMSGQPMLRYDSNGFYFVLPARSGDTLRPLSSATEPIDEITSGGTSCADPM